MLLELLMPKINTKEFKWIEKISPQIDENKTFKPSPFNKVIFVQFENTQKLI